MTKTREEAAIETLEQTRWIPVSEKLPKNAESVNITWVNHNPVSYYADIKDKPFVSTGHYYKGKWWWYLGACQDILDEYEESENDEMADVIIDEMADEIEVIAWTPLPKPYQLEVNKY